MPPITIATTCVAPRRYNLRCSYERALPVTNNVVDAKRGIPHFNTGDGGADLYTTWLDPQPAWSAIRSAVWGHGELTFVNSTTAVWRWLRNSDADPTVADTFVLINHAPAL